MDLKYLATTGENWDQSQRCWGQNQRNLSEIQELYERNYQATWAGKHRFEANLGL